MGLVPSISKGWTGTHAKAKESVIDFTLDARKYFDHAGPYTVRLVKNKKPAGHLLVRSVELLADGTSLCKDEHDGLLAESESRNTYRLDLPEYDPDSEITLRVTMTRTRGHAGIGGKLFVTPLLPPLPADWRETPPPLKGKW
jgi:hypothetical protein